MSNVEQDVSIRVFHYNVDFLFLVLALTSNNYTLPFGSASQLKEYIAVNFNQLQLLNSEVIQIQLIAVTRIILRIK